MEKTYTFSQSSVKLIVSGLPDYSRNDRDENISIISSWKILIANKPEIEGSVEHLKSIIKSIYEYSYLILFEEEKEIRSELIDIKLGQSNLHYITLKSTKPKVNPLVFNIGNAELSDIVNCFDQLNNSENVNLKLIDLDINHSKKRIKSFSKKSLIIKVIPVLIAILSVSFISISCSYLYRINESSDNKVSFLDANIR